MQPTTTSSTVIDALYGLGERLCLALEAGDVEAAGRLVKERGVLVAALQRFAQAEPEPNRQQHVAAFAQQQRAIVAAAEAHGQRLEAALEALGHVRHARARYTAGPARVPILNKNLCV